ncbi:MAG: 1-acyl-sn-glycerol-3-phosphate acyltransferase [Desulfuromonadales bacterium]|nr:1-acyl-sn-glycerol-3-phosphate acyltransferase [Desulfuromonadales bacterium]
MFERLRLYALNLYFYTFFILLSATVIPLFTLYVVCRGLCSSRRRTMKRFRRAINWYGLVVMAIPYPFVRLRYLDQGNSDPGEPYIFVCNHRSASDAYLMGILPHELVQVVNVWPFRIPVLGIYAKWAGYLNIRMLPPEEFMASAERLLRDGVSVVFFPEGTRSTDRSMGSFHGSAFRLALASKAAVVPLCISGSETVPPKGSALLHPGTIVIRRLPAVTWDEYRDLTPFAFKNRIWKMMDHELKVMENRV